MEREIIRHEHFINYVSSRGHPDKMILNRESFHMLI